MSTNTELIARLRLIKGVCDEAADAIEALESQRDDLRSQVDSLNVGFNNCQKERDAFRDERNRLNQLWGDAQALHGYQVAIETAEESLKDRVALAMEVDRLSAAGVSHCGHRPPRIECRKYAAPIPQQVAEPSVPEGWKQAVALAYGHLWHVNNEPMAPTPLRSSETAAYEARKQLRDLLTHEERGLAINQVQTILAAAPQPKEKQ